MRAHSRFPRIVEVKLFGLEATYRSFLLCNLRHKRGPCPHGAQCILAATIPVHLIFKEIDACDMLIAAQRERGGAGGTLGAMRLP